MSADDNATDAKPLAQELSKPPPSSETTTQQLEPSPNPTTLAQTAVQSDAPSTSDFKGASSGTTAPTHAPTPTPVADTGKSRSLDPSAIEAAEVIYVPSYSRWFSWNNVHECEVRFLPEFFDGKSPSKNPKVYKYYRNTIIKRFRENPLRKSTFTEARRTIVGDVASIRKVFDFLETWGLINYSPSVSKPQLKWEDKETKSAVSAATAAQSGEPAPGVNDVTIPKKRLCGSCKCLCTIACFACNKLDLTLCARCYVRGNYRVGVNSSDFRRVEINEEIKSDWTDKETLLLLEAVMHYGEDWKKVAEHVGGRSEKECVARFIKLPFGEQFFEPTGSAEAAVDNDDESGNRALKKMRLNPLADASNPIMAQAAFLSALVGVEVAEVAAQAAVKALSELSDGRVGTLPSSAAHHELNGGTSNGNSVVDRTEDHVEVRQQLEKEERELDKAVSEIVNVQMKDIRDKIAHFEEYELQIEKEWQHLQNIENLLFVDQLNLLFHQTDDPKTGENVEGLKQSDYG